MAPSGNKIEICPRKIRYTQDSIKEEFTDGRHMSDTLDALIYGRLSVDDLEPIEVVREYGKWWALTGNRRLYLYRKLEELGVIHTITVVTASLDNDRVQNQLMRRKTTECEGVAIRLRGNQSGWRINQVVEEWKASQRNNRYVKEGWGDQNTPERSGSQRGKSLDRNSSTIQANSSNGFNAVINPPSLRQGSAVQRSSSTERASVRAITPGPNSSASRGQHSSIYDQFYDGRGKNPVASSSGSVRSSLNIRTTSGMGIPYCIAPAQPGRSNSSSTGGWGTNGGVAGSGQNSLESPDVITVQPRSSTDPIMSSEDSCCSCCGDSCCSRCCCCCCFTSSR